jgi:hypothetical protein
MKLYVLYDKVQNKLIAEMKRSATQQHLSYILGAVDIEKDGNYFDRLIITGVLEQKGNVLGLKEWWKWALDSDSVEMSDEFGFSVNDVEVRELTLGQVIDNAQTDR